MNEKLDELRTKRLVVDIPAELHKQLKIISVKKNITIRKLIIKGIIDRITYEKQFE